MTYHITFSGGRGRNSQQQPPTPQNLQVLLQGQTAPNSTTSPPTPASPNYTLLGWDNVPGATYNIYRSTISAISGFNLYDTSPTNSYADTAANNCVNGTFGSGPQFYPGTTYWYRVTAVINSVESYKSDTQKFVIYQNGTYNWGGDFTPANTTVNYADTVGGPQGGVADIAVSFTALGGAFVPFSGNLATQYNFWAGAFAFLSLDLRPSIVSQSWRMFAQRYSNVSLYDNTGTPYTIDPTAFGPAPINGTWATYKIPLAAFLSDFSPTGNVGPAVQLAMFEFDLADNTGNSSGTWYVDNIILTGA